MKIKPLVTFSLVIFSIVFLAIIIGGYLSVKYPANLQSVPSSSSVQNLPSAVSPATVVASKNTITITDVAKHNTANDCWLAINGKAYNVTSFENSHPGGKNAIVSNCGTEVSGIFASIHSNFAWDLLGKYYVGPIS